MKMVALDRLSLRRRLLLVTGGLMLLFVLAGAYVVRELATLSRAKAETQLLETTRALSLVVDREYDGYAAMLRGLAASFALKQGDWAELHRIARAMTPGTDEWLVISDREGRQLVNTRLPDGTPLPRTTWRPDVLAAFDRGVLRACPLSQGLVERRILCLDQPVMRDGRAALIVSVIFKPERLQRIIDQQQVPASRFATIVDGNGVVVWRNVNPERFVGVRATPDMLKAIAARPQGVRESRSLEGVPTVIAHARGQYGLNFMVAVPRDQIGAIAAFGARSGLIISALLMALALVIAFMFGKRLSDGIAQLAGAATALRDQRPPRFVESRVPEIDTVGMALVEAHRLRRESEDRFELAQEVGEVGAWDWNLARDEGEVTKGYARVHGLPVQDEPLKLAQVIGVLHPDDRARYLAGLAENMTATVPVSDEYRVVHPDGSVHWVAFKRSLIRDESGAPIRSVGIVQDVTAARAAEAALAESEERLRLATEGTGIGIYDLNLTRGSGPWSNRAFEVLGLDPTPNGIGTFDMWARCLHPDERDDVIERHQENAARRGAWKTEYRVVRPNDGETRWLETFGRFIEQPDGSLRSLGVVADVTDRKRTELSLAESEASLRNLNETLEAQVVERTEQLRQSQKLEGMGQLTGGVAHDFNNLLTPIIGSLDMLQRRGVGGEREQRLIDGALQSAERAKTLVQRLLSFARRQPLQAVPVDLASLIAGMADLIGSTSGPKVKLLVDVSPRLPTVRADPNQLELALLNLAVNARDAMPDGGQLTIAAAAHAVGADHPSGLVPGRYARLAVSDTGTGMDADTLARAIEPFFSTKGVGQGTGLGLSMVHGLAAQLGGALTIDSKPGLGTTVELWLPLARKRASAAAAPDEPAGEALASSVLLVDDDRLVRVSTAEMLADMGYAVVEADSAEEAWRLMEGGLSFDLLISDHLMPGLSGTELARRVRTRMPATPVLIISGYAEVEGIAPDLPRLVKPFRRAELAAALATVHGPATAALRQTRSSSVPEPS